MSFILTTVLTILGRTTCPEQEQNTVSQQDHLSASETSQTHLEWKVVFVVALSYIHSGFDH